MLLLDAPTSAEKRRARCGPGRLDVLERGEEDGLEGGTSETTGGAIWVRGLDVRVARENVTEPAQEGGRVKFSQGIGDLIARLDVDHADGLTENELAKNQRGSASRPIERPLQLRLLRTHANEPIKRLA